MTHQPLLVLSRQAPSKNSYFYDKKHKFQNKKKFTKIQIQNTNTDTKMQIQKYKFKYVQTMSYEAHLVLSRQTTSRNDDDDDYDDYNHGDSGGADDDTSVQQDALGLASQEECTEGAKEYKSTSPAAEPHLGLPGKPTTNPLSKQTQI